MSPISAFLALTLMRGQAGGPSQQGFGTMTLANRVVKVEFPTAPVVQLPDDVKTWEGFKYAPAASRDWPGAFAVPGDWAPVGDKFLAVPAGKTPVVWRTKVVVVTQADIVSPLGDSKLYRQDRTKIDTNQLTSVLASLARFASWVKAETNGELTLSLDVSVDPETFYSTTGGIDAKKAAAYLEARFNGGKFEAEDKAYRGPYNSVVLIHPAPGVSGETAMVNGTPCTPISFFDTWVGGVDPASSGLEPAMMKALVNDLNLRRRELGLTPVPADATVASLVAGVPSPRSMVEPTDYPDFATFDDVSVDRLTALYKKPAKPDALPADQAIEAYRLAPLSPNVTLSVVTDPERGKVLKYSEISPVRLGGFALPGLAQIDRNQNKFLKFWVKSSSRDDLGFVSYDGSAIVRQPLSGFAPDGKWHEVTVELAGPNVKWFALAPMTPGREKTDAGPIEYVFSDFQAGPDGGVIGTAYSWPNNDPAVKASTLTAEALAKEPTDFIRLNGLMNHEGPYDAKDEAALIALAHDANVQIAGAAIRQLAKLGTQTAKTEIVRLIVSSPFEHTKQVAGLEVGKMADPKLAGVLSRLFGSSHWPTRMAGAQALAMVPGDEAAVISMTFLQEIDPAIRLVVTTGANVQNPVVVKRLLWSAVNDPSDAVRATSCLCLIFSGNAKAAAEGYKGIRDDSVAVRLDILDGLTAKPDEAHRGAIRIAVVDASPRVRAAALRAFGTLKDVNIDEIANTLEDKYPSVQMALIDLAIAKHLALPKTALDSLKASIDPRVVEKAKDLVP